MKKGHELKIRERLSKSYLQVIFIEQLWILSGRYWEGDDSILRCAQRGSCGSGIYG